MWFKRNDGTLMEAAEDSASFQMMERSPEFAPCDDEGNEIHSEAEQSAVANDRAEGDPRQSGTAKRGGTRKPDQTKNSDGK